MRYLVNRRRRRFCSVGLDTRLCPVATPLDHKGLLSGKAHGEQHNPLAIDAVHGAGFPFAIYIVNGGKISPSCYIKKALIRALYHLSPSTSAPPVYAPHLNHSCPESLPTSSSASVRYHQYSGYIEEYLFLVD